MNLFIATTEKFSEEFCMRPRYRNCNNNLKRIIPEKKKIEPYERLTVKGNSRNYEGNFPHESSSFWLGKV